LKLNASGSGLIYATFIGGSGDDRLHDIALDDSGNVYATGYTTSSNFPTVNAYSSVQNGSSDVFVFKLNATGNGLDFSTYVGGIDMEYGNSIAIDSSGNSYVSGYTRSSNFPTVEAFDETLDGIQDSIVFKLNASGNGILYSTYIGGNGYDQSDSISVDSTGYAYISGLTGSSDFPTANSYDSTHNGGDDVFLLKLNTTGKELIYSTYIGGSDTDRGYAQTIDSDGNVYLAGETHSSNFPILNAYDSSYNGNSDCFITKVNPTGDSLNFSTYIGGFSADVVLEIEVDSSGYVYASCRTYSSSFPVVNAYDTVYDDNGDVAQLKLSKNGSLLLYSTFIGGSGPDFSGGMDVDINGTVYVTGWTSSSNFPLVNPFNSTSTGDQAFIFKLGDASDADNDGISDYDESQIGSDRYDSDTDDDTMPDGWEYYNGLDATNSTDASLDKDSDGLLNYLEYSNGTDPSNPDSDADLLSDGDEVNTHFTDPNDWDSDDDTLSDGDEIITYGTNPLNTDTDSDLMPDDWEVDNALNATDPLDSVLDPDDDQLLNLFEFYNSTDPHDSDSDDDLMPDGWEVFNGLNPLNPSDSTSDSDSDNLTNLEEFQNSTDPNDNDTEDDGMPDGWEIQFGLNATLDDSGSDFDSDSLTNLQEYENATDPYDPDTDDDDLDDGSEVNSHGTDPNNPDSDFDLMPDGWEVSNSLNPLFDDSSDDPDTDTLLNIDEYLNGTNPHDSDSDDDLIPDGWEVQNSLNATDATDAILDFDSDGLTNLREYQYSTNPNDADSDNDDLLDGEEIDLYNTNPLNSDSDSDLMPDGWEVEYGLNPLVDDANDDFDSDELSNYDEFVNNCNPTNSDSDDDQMPDLWEVTHNLNATNPADAILDIDDDDLSNLAEFNSGTDPRDSDTDDDNLSDGEEVLTYSTNPLNPDSDSDSLTDGDEVNIYGTDPLDSDSDDDLISDGAEIAAGTNPLVPDTDNDRDNDGLSDYEEYQLGTNPNRDDSDGDGLLDGWEVERGHDPLEWTMNPGQVTEHLSSYIQLAGLPAFVLLVIGLVGAIIDTKFKPLKLLGKRALLIPGIILLLVFFMTVPGEAVMIGSTDPGSNSTSQRLSEEGSISFSLEGGTPWFTDSITVSVSTRLTVMADYIDGTVTVTQDGSPIGSFTFEFGRGAFIETETASRVFTANPSNGPLSIQLTYDYYSTISGPYSRGFPMTLAASQGEADGRNLDQQTWPGIRNMLFVTSLGILVLGIIVPTSRKSISDD
jgi:hypothetical protein